MNAIVPLSITAIRVNKNDESNIVNQFKGRTAVFDQLPYTSNSTETSTGDNIVRPLNTQSSPGIALGTGVHVHWLLPDYFRKGAQQTTGEIVFPAAPNRWLVTRYLSLWNESTSSYGSPTAQTFMVESDFISGTRQADPWGVVRPAISVPLPAIPVAGQHPYRYMGRVLDFNSWNPSGEQLNNYLPAQTGANGQPLYLTSIGFVGPSFASYYPECNGVFGFWDHFKDQTTIYNAINNNQPIQFKVSYQVTGWINETNKDPLTDLTQIITNIYNNYVADCNSQNVEITQTPGDVFLQYMSDNFGWAFPAGDISWTLKSDQTINTLTIPQSTLCSGIMQEIVWNMETNTNSYFLNNPNSAEQPSGVWTDTVEIAIGNTMTEALSALMKYDLGESENVSEEVLNNYEYLLDALQLGYLNDLENQNSKLINLQESLHSAAFSKQGGGLLWIINQQSSGIDTPQNPDQQITLPLVLAEQLNQLNMAQKNYDQGREKLSRFRRQLFMDWLHYVKLFVNPKIKDFVTANQVMAFLSSSNVGELNSVVAMGNDTGILNYNVDPVTSEIISPQQPSGSTSSLAYAVWAAFQTVQTALAEYSDWVIGSAPAPPFWQATDPVLLLEGNLIVPPRRNGGDNDLFVRTSLDILNELKVTYNGATFNIQTNLLPGIPAINPNTPQVQDVTQLTLEAYALVPSMAVLVGNWLQAVGGGSNPAVENLNAFILSLQNAQGGLSPLESATTAGLYAAINANGYVAVINPQQ
ncbi:MAG: hypothetical protein ACRC3B_14000, partial [Bacteroidia bacterium]